MAPAMRALVGVEPEGSDIVDQGLGWRSTHGTGHAGDAITSGLEVTWTSTPTKWSNEFFRNLFQYEWELTKSPAGAQQWRPKDGAGASQVPDAHDPSKRHAPGMLTTDLALRFDPAYEKISRRFLEHPEEFADAFARAWFKLTHRDMGPKVRYLGPLVPKETLIWQDPVPEVDHPLIDAQDVAALKAKVLASGLTVPQLVSTAWASASTFRGSDKRGGANGARIRLAPQKDWAVNQPDQLATVLAKLEAIRQEFNASAPGGKKISLADLIVLAGGAAVEKAAKDAGQDVQVPFTPGRTDASQEQTDVVSFAPLEPKVDGFRNYLGETLLALTPEELLVDRAQLLTLTAPEMTVLVGGLRVLGANVGKLARRLHRAGGSADQRLLRQPARHGHAVDSRPRTPRTCSQGRDRKTEEVKWTGTRVDLIFGSHSQLRALAEVYGASDCAGEVREGLRGGLDQGDRTSIGSISPDHRTNSRPPPKAGGGRSSCQS